MSTQARKNHKLRSETLRTWVCLVGMSLTGCGPSPAPESGSPSPAPTPSPSPISVQAQADPTPTPAPTATPIPTPTPEPTPTPIPFIPRKNVDVARFYNGITVASEVEVVESEHTASMDRRRLDSYLLEMTLRIRLPVAAKTLNELKANDPSLPRLLPDLEAALATATVSPAFATLYQNKVNYIRPRLNQLEEILSRHNFYDCDTILEIEHPESGRRFLLISADMDVNVDGSDGDRNWTVEPSSPFFQPTTSYRWPKQSERPNPFLEITEKRIAELRTELAAGKADAARRTTIQSSLETLNNRLRELRRWSFLISDADPSIVLPGFMLRSGTEHPFQPAFGNYAAVIHNGVVYPAIVGDAGPSHKMGEASMRICREIEPRTSAARRAVSDVRVHYVVFVGTGQESERRPPQLEEWNDQVTSLWQEIGGQAEAIHRWADVIPPWPTPTPSPTASPSPTAELLPEASPTASPSPMTELLPEASPTASPSPTTELLPEASPSPSTEASPSAP